MPYRLGRFGFCLSYEFRGQAGPTLFRTGLRESICHSVYELSDLWKATSPDAVNISGDFSSREFAAALHYLKPGKVPGPDSICPELLIHSYPSLKFWLRGFLSSYWRRLKIPIVCRKALVVAILKPSGPVEHPQSYRPLSLLCIPYKILERLIYNRVKPTVGPCSQRSRLDFDTQSLQ